MTDSGDKSKKSANSFAMLSKQMKEVEKSKKPNQGTSFKSNRDKAENSRESLNRSNSSKAIVVEDNMSPPRNESETDPDVPDRSYGDYFCRLCDSHMNSDAMWNAHITGKRHMKNIDKGEQDLKYDHLTEESVLKQEIKNVKDPVIGLSYIHEIRRKDKGAPSIFTCYLCQATFPSPALMIEHVLTLKHRMNFMKENSPVDYQLLEATKLKKGQLEPLVEEMSEKLEKKFGKGAAKVKQEKFKAAPAYTYSSKRALDVKDDEEERNPRKNMKFDKDSYSRKREQPSKKDFTLEKDKYSRDVDRRKRCHSSSDDEDTYKRRNSPSKSQPSKKVDYFEKPKRYESPFPRDSYKRDSFYSKKSISPVRSFRHCSTPPRESVKENYKIPYGPEPPPYITPSSLHRKEETPASSSSTVACNTVQRLISEMGVPDFIKKVIFSLSSECFLTLVLERLNNLNMKSIKELDLVSSLVHKGSSLLNKHLSPGVQTAINQALSQSANISSNSPQLRNPIPDSSSLPNRPQPQGDLSFIKKFLEDTRSASVLTSPVLPTETSPIGGGVGIPTQRSSIISGSVGVPTQRPSSMGGGVTTQKHPSYDCQTFGFGSSSRTYGNSNQAYGNSSQAYGNSSQAYENSSQAYENSNQTCGNSSQTYRNSNLTFETRSPSTQGNVNSYQSSNSSLQNYASSYQNSSYRNVTSSTSATSSGIPGLTLADENKGEQNNSYGIPPNQSSHYPSYRY